MSKIVVIDTGSANSLSIMRSLDRFGHEASLTVDPSDFEFATRLILPGVGAFDSAMEHLSKHKMLDVLEYVVLQKRVPILGICIGMQILFQGSDEGARPGLGLLEGKVERLIFEPNSKCKVPNTGFAKVNNHPLSPLYDGLPQGSYFYFNHSYAVRSAADDLLVDHADHTLPFISSFSSGNICGVQYHPEKSQLAGMRVLKNFLTMKASIE